MIKPYNTPVRNVSSSWHSAIITVHKTPWIIWDAKSMTVAQLVI